MKLFAAYTSGGPNNYENVMGKPWRAGGGGGGGGGCVEAFLEIGNANVSKRLPINLGTTTNNIAGCALVFFNDSSSITVARVIKLWQSVAIKKLILQLWYKHEFFNNLLKWYIVNDK